MRYQKYLPHAGLRKHIRCYWTFEGNSRDTSSDDGLYVLAEGVEFLFNLADGNGQLPCVAKTAATSRSCVYGPMTSPMRLKPVPKAKVFGICFRPGGASPFFPHPIDELKNSYAEIDDIWESKSSEIIQRIQEARKTTKERIDLLNLFFLAQINKIDRKDLYLSAAVDVIESNKGRVIIDDLAGSVGLSSRQLERNFKQRIGMTPKQLCCNLRFKHVFKHLLNFPAESWAAIALACGYYDQSHMINEFKRYTGSSPAAFFSEPMAIEKYFIGNFSK